MDEERGRTNIEISVSRHCGLYDSSFMSPGCSDCSQENHKCKPKDTTQRPPRFRAAMGSNTYTTYGRSPTRSSTGSAKGPFHTRLSVVITIQEDLHCESFCLSEVSADFEFFSK